MKMLPASTDGKVRTILESPFTPKCRHTGRKEPSQGKQICWQGRREDVESDWPPLGWVIFVRRVVLEVKVRKGNRNGKIDVALHAKLRAYLADVVHIPSPIAPSYDDDGPVLEGLESRVPPAAPRRSAPFPPLASKIETIKKGPSAPSRGHVVCWVVGPVARLICADVERTQRHSSVAVVVRRRVRRRVQSSRSDGLVPTDVEPRSVPYFRARDKMREVVVVDER